MPLNLHPHRGLIVLLLFFGLTLLTPLAAHKKRKATEEETKSKSKAKPIQKIDPKQLAKTARDSRKEEERHKKQLAQKKKDEDKEEKKRSKQLGKLAAKQREEKTNDKSPGKDKTAKREADKKNDKAKDKLAKRDAEKKNDKADKIKDKLAKREDDKKASKKELAAKKLPPEKDTKHSKTAAEIAEAKTKVKADKQNSKAKPEEKRAELAKQIKIASNAKYQSDHKQEPEDKIKVLPPSKFTLRPVAKALSKIELKFTVARAVALTSFDAPPPRETAPDVIDVIEHNSQDAKRLDDLVRSEMKSPQFSSVPNISHKKLDVGKMEGERIRQIQEALAKKGYYSGEISGQYGEATIEAMRKFQEEHRVDVTGYATAQSLKLLGLTDW